MDEHWNDFFASNLQPVITFVLLDDCVFAADEMVFSFRDDVESDKFSFNLL